MKEFIDNIKNAFNVLPEYLVILIIICCIVGTFNGIDAVFDVFVVLLSAWAVIFIGLPFVVLILDTINRIFGLVPKDKKTNK